MNFSFSEEQGLLRQSARSFLEAECPKSLIRKLEASEQGYSPDIWRKMAELGWLSLVIPQEYEGFGGSLMDLAVLLEEMGRAALPSPMFATIAFGALPILEAGKAEHKSGLLPGVARGETILTLALVEPEAEYDPACFTTRAVKKGDGFSLSGVKLFVPYAHVANHMLVAASTADGSAKAGITLFLINGKEPGVDLTPIRTIANDPQFEVRLDNVHASSGAVLGTLHNGWPVVESLRLRAAALQCAEMVGIAQKELEMTAQYATNRIQFERPIGSFQAVQMRLANMLTDVEGSRWTTYQAIWRLSRGMDASREVAIAQAWTSDALQRVAFEAQRIHGGIGMDLEYDLQFYFRRAKSLELNLGSAPVHKRALEVHLGL